MIIQHTWKKLINSRFENCWLPLWRLAQMYVLRSLQLTSFHSPSLYIWTQWSPFWNVKENPIVLLHHHKNKVKSIYSIYQGTITIEFGSCAAQFWYENAESSTHLIFSVSFQLEENIKWSPIHGNLLSEGIIFGSLYHSCFIIIFLMKSFSCLLCTLTKS